MAILRYLGIAEEESFNPTTPPAADIHLDIGSASLDSPTDSEVFYTGGLGRAPRIKKRMTYQPSGNVVYPIDLESAPYFLKWALGGYLFTDGTHEIWGDNSIELPSFTARIGKDQFEHVFTGCGVNSLTLAIDEWSELTVDVVAAKDSKAALKDISDLSLTQGTPLAYHEFEVSVGGSDISAKVKSLTLSISNSLTTNSGLGSMYPRRHAAGEREVTVEMDIFFDSLAHLEAFWGDTSGPSADGSNTAAVELTGDGGEGVSMSIMLPKAAYTQAQQQPSGRDELLQSVTLRALTGEAVLSDATPVVTDILVTINNNGGAI